jgi:hypothetical protein
MTDLSQAQIAPATTGEEQRVPVSQIRQQSEHRPRKSRNKSQYEAIRESIRKDGVIQST